MAIPLSNAISVSNINNPLKKFSNNSMGYMCSGGKDLQNTKYISLYSSGIYVNKENILQISTYFTICKIMKATWINDRD